MKTRTLSLSLSVHTSKDFLYVYGIHARATRGKQSRQRGENRAGIRRRRFHPFVVFTFRFFLSSEDPTILPSQVVLCVSLVLLVGEGAKKKETFVVITSIFWSFLTEFRQNSPPPKATEKKVSHITASPHSP